MLTTFVVTTLSDDADDRNGVPDGEISLREAVEAANRNAAFGDAPAGSPGLDTITTNITGFREVALQQGQLRVTDDLRVLELDLDAGGRSRAFDVSASLTLELVAVYNGRSASGGAILARTGSSLTVRDGVFRGNVSTGAGGAVRAVGADVTLTKTVIEACGALVGGGLALTRSTLTADGSLVLRSEAVRYGGGILAEDSAVTIEGGVVTGNAAGISGGGIHHSGAEPLSVSDSRFEQNSGPAGGGALAVNGPGGVRLRDALIRNNGAASGSGGGLLLERSHADAAATRFEGNEAAARGGGIAAVASEVTLVRVEAERNFADFGGFLALSGGSATVSRGRFGVENAGNTAVRSGGAVFAAGAADVLLGATDLSYNVSRGTGGAVHAGPAADLRVANGGEMRGNVAPRGGAVYSVAETFITDTAFTLNFADEGGGLLQDGGRLRLADCRLQGNAAGVAGGGVLFDSPTPGLLLNTDFQSNRANTRGGAVDRPAGGGRLTVVGGAIEGNQSNGGGVRLEGSRLVATDTEFVDNSARRGGGLRAIDGSDAVTRGGTRFLRNTAAESGGGVLPVDSDASFTDTVFDGNRAELLSGGPSAPSTSRATASRS